MVLYHVMVYSIDRDFKFRGGVKINILQQQYPASCYNKLTKLKLPRHQIENVYVISLRLDTAGRCVVQSFH